MTEKPTDWRIQVVLDRKALVEDLGKLTKILARQRTYCVVSAVNEAEALKKAEEHLQRISGISPVYVKAMHPRRLPT
jgi:ribosomal protein L5